MTDAPGAPPAPADPFALLLSVQDLDTSITQHEHRKVALPERAERDALGQRAGELRARVGELTARREELATRLSQLEEQSNAVTTRRKVLEDRLYGARGAAGRDLQAIEGEISQLAVRLDQLEDDELVLMEELDPLDAELERDRAELGRLDEEAGALGVRVAELERIIDAELVELADRRQDEAARLPEALARRYEQLRARLGGTGAARLVGDRCDGCHLTLPAVEVDRIKHLGPDEVATCDQCGRILIRISA